MISITMTPETFECVIKKLHDVEGVTISDLNEETGYTGHIHTKYVDADFEYREEGRSVVFLNEKKHGLYGFVSDDTIGTHLNDMLSKFNCPESASASEEQILSPAPETLPEVPNADAPAPTNAFVTPAAPAPESEVK